MKTLVLQQGHVPRTSGATGAPGEQAMARRVAEAVAGLMPHAGWRLRVIDADEPVRRYRGDAFVSLHGDASGNPDVGGASVGYRTVEGRRLAQAWKDAYVRHGWPFGWRADNYTAALAGYYGHRHAVRQGNPAAIIVEHGFMTNPAERAWIDSPDGTRAAALAVVEAVTGSVPGQGTPDVDMDLEDFMATLSPSEQKTLKKLANVNAEAVDHWAKQAGKADREALGDFAKGLRTMDTTPRTMGAGIVALWREAGARGWLRDLRRFAENRVYSERDLR